jgi:hypothetical protein
VRGRLARSEGSATQLSARTETRIAEERKLTPPRIDERWPIKCDGCDYQFTNRDRYQMITVPLSEIAE